MRVDQPPPNKRRRKKKKITNTNHPPPPLSFTSLPDDIILNCLARIPKSHYRLLSLVSKTIRSLLSSQELYAVRSEIGNTEHSLYICPKIPTNYDRWCTLDQTLLTGGRIEDVFSLSRITRPTSSASPPPTKPTTLAVGFEIYQMGGTINDEQPSSAVRVLDCRTHTWRDAPDMTVARKSAESAFIDGKIYVVGGTEESKNCGEVFDLKSQTWEPLPCLTDDDTEVWLCIGEIYATGKRKKYAYDTKQRRWKELVEFCFGPGNSTSGPWCVIENVKFSVFQGRLVMWYDTERRNWFIVEGFKYERGTTIHLANHGGKLLLVRKEPRTTRSLVPGAIRSVESSVAWPRRIYRHQRIRCEVIKLEKRIGSSGLEIRGKIVWSNAVFSFPNSYDFLSCIITL